MDFLKQTGWLLIATTLLACSTNKKMQKSSETAAAISDTTQKKQKQYSQVITNKAITKKGLLTIHKVDDKYYFEIADSLLGKDILMVNRISKAAAGTRLENDFGFAGDYIGENVIQFEKGPNKKLFIKRISFLEISKDSSADGMLRSVLNSSLQPIAASFDIKTVSPDSSSTVIDVTDYLNGDNDVFFFNTKLKAVVGLGGLQSDKSYIQEINSFPSNTEIKTIKTYTLKDQPVTYELNSSIVLLPADPMKPRNYDERVGYFSRGYINYDEPQRVKVENMITRWRLEPKDEDKYKRGELVEPKKPIVFYIDPATPKKWVPYLIQGVNAWQKAFEKAGFKNAIYALEAPANDSTWSMEDARHNAIVYKASYLQNASGPQISDPRTGEILESHINWYHNVQKLLHDWYFLQVAPVDPRARKMVFDDTLMGELIRYVCTHEVGHTLGLQHNFIASSTVATDSLRSRTYVAKYGHTPSIMDYARFNYVAQPEDNIDAKDLIPCIGAYDEWAIEWGYKWLPDFKTAEEEKTAMNQWIIDRLNKDKHLLFVTYIPLDARNQMEDLGDDAMKAGYYGIKNLQRLMTHLKDWTSTPNGDYREFERMRWAVIAQYRRYLDFAVKNIGSLNVSFPTREQPGTVFDFPSKEKQRAALRFLNEQLFDVPAWLDDKDMFPYTGGGTVIWLEKIQETVLHLLVNGSKWNAMVFAEGVLPKDKVYTFSQLLDDMEADIWKELKTHEPINVYRRSLQRIYISKLTDLIRFGKTGDMSFQDLITNTDHRMKLLYDKLTAALPGFKDADSRIHLEDLHTRLKVALEDRRKNLPEYDFVLRRFYNNNNSGLEGNNLKEIRTSLLTEESNNHIKGCWEDDDLMNYNK